MKSNAPGQLLGYSLQYPRALLRLLQLNPGESVAIEMCGDVSVMDQQGIIIAEEDKSSIVSNPLNDRSTNLWKTFFNWVKMLQEQELEIQQTRFILYANSDIPDNTIVRLLDDADNNSGVSIAINAVSDLFATLPQNHNAKPYLEYLLGKGKALFIDVIPKFELETTKNTAELYNEIRTELRKKLYDNYLYVDLAMNNIQGWLKQQIEMKIAAQEPTVISFEEFEISISIFFQQLRTRSLVDFTKEIAENTIEDEVQKQPIYIQMLDHICATPGEMLEAVSNYMRSATNRLEWIKRGIIDENIMSDFLKNLKSFHANNKAKIDLTASEKDDVYRGKLLYLECSLCQNQINNQQPPAGTVIGTYHHLANEKEIGWHPAWKELIGPKEEGDK